MVIFIPLSYLDLRKVHVSVPLFFTDFVTNDEDIVFRDIGEYCKRTHALINEQKTTYRYTSTINSI